MSNRTMQNYTIIMSTTLYELFKLANKYVKCLWQDLLF